MSTTLYKYLFPFLLSVISISPTKAQGNKPTEGKCNSDVHWSFDGSTLTITKIEKQTNGNRKVSLPNYTKDDIAPWAKRNLTIKKVIIGAGIKNIGSRAFANCTTLERVEFKTSDIEIIGDGAFYNCERLRMFSIPVEVRQIGYGAFSGCTSLRSVSIPQGATIGDYAFSSCTNMSAIDIPDNVELGKYIFAILDKDGKPSINYNGDIIHLPKIINENNSRHYGISEGAVKLYKEKNLPSSSDNDSPMSDVDKDIPQCNTINSNTYALIIGNEKYRKGVSNVTFANHDANVFSEYCKLTLGIPSTNIRLCLDATKYMILEEAIGEWLKEDITDRESKKLIVYYAGHGIPDINNSNKSYILPVDVSGSKPSHAIALDDFYKTISDLGFMQVTFFVDACFSGKTRTEDPINNGERPAMEISAEECVPPSGNIVIFSAAQGNEPAQSYQTQGHGLFTYYLLKVLKETEGSLQYDELYKSIKTNVYDTANKHGKKQTPIVIYSKQSSDFLEKSSF